ncbi:MotA/TolQ/ExbB proton channel family protein [Catalinimonas sp. 4WD22]|uniref:MotA/TolQ/ExbB proton channel family protein n=1 Tax=Catalinimonas locisalis TaxID=3133978 RepID=UPI0031018568
MIDLFYTGDPIFMGILTLIFLVALSIATVSAIQIFSNQVKDYLRMRRQITYIKSVGLFGLVFGIFSQSLGLYDMFSAIEAAGDISPGLLYSGLKVSSITSMYGLVIFLASYLLWLGLNVRLNRVQSINKALQ